MTELTTRRLVLTPLDASELHPLHAHWTEPEVRRYLWDGRSVDLEEVRNIITKSSHLFETLAVGLWSVRQGESETPIGCVGFWYFHEPPELELVLSLSAAWWGRGMATEAASALLDYVFGELGWATVQGSADAPNARSLALMRRLGMQPIGERPGEFGRTEVFRITQREWTRVREDVISVAVGPDAG